MRLLILLLAGSRLVAGLTLNNGVVDASFDSSGRLQSLSDATKADALAFKFDGDGWVFDLGDLPMPSGAKVQNNSQIKTDATCAADLPSPKSKTTVDQCAFACLATEVCESFTAINRPTTWGRPMIKCLLHQCAGTFRTTKPSQYSLAGLKPRLPVVVTINASSCGNVAASQPTHSTIEMLHSDCQGFQVNATYELAEGWHFVTKHLAVCRQAKDGKCDPKAGFTVRHVNVWPGLKLDADVAMGAMGMNVYARNLDFGSFNKPGSSETASFWRTKDNKAGLFASVQTSFFESGEGFGAFHWGASNERWGSCNYGVWQIGAAITDKAGSSLPAHVSDTLNIQAKSAKGGTDVALLLERTASLSKDTTVAVTVVEGYATNKATPQPLNGGYAGVVFGASASTATATATATVDGFAAVVSLYMDPKGVVKKTARFLRLTGSLETTDAFKTLAEAEISAPSDKPIRLEVHAPAGLSGNTTLSIDGTVVLSALLAAELTSMLAAQSGVGLIALTGQQASFYNFVSSAQPATQSPVRPGSSLIQGRYSPKMTQVASLGTWHQADSGVLGLTQLTGYELPESGVDIGETQAFTSCVDHFLMDKEMRKAGAIRYQVAWDSNEYQLDMSKEADRDEYKRLIVRNAELGIKYQVYEPRNTAVASRFDHTDAWWWEEVLWFQMGIGIRNGSWEPGRDALPATVKEMLDFFKEQGVSPAAYAYPTLAWRAEGDDEWLYDSPKREAGDLGKRASLASPKLQDYLVKTMNTFLNVTGGSGFAWDYGILGDTGVANYYQEVRGWLRILAGIRHANPKMVMDHRQIAHNFGPWYHLAGSYSEPIAGDENPESYGATLASLSTDHILADNLRLSNYRYRLQLLPNERVPGFMFHQTERHFNNGTGTDSMGRPGDKTSSTGQKLWKADPYPGPDGNFSGVTYSNCVIDKDWHTRDFDFLGYRYSVVSTLGTAGRNLVVANVPARDLDEYNAFPKEDIAWIRKWFDWADTNGEALRNTLPLAGYGYPRLGFVDGTSAVNNNAGFIFLYNPSPDMQSATLNIDESLGLRGGSGSWLVSEIYPREDGMPLGVWQWKDSVTFNVPGSSARILKLDMWKGALLDAPIAFNISYDSIDINDKQEVVISGASELAGSTSNVVVRLPSKNSATSDIVINGASVSGKAAECFDTKDKCISASVTFSGSASLRQNSMAGAALTKQDGSYHGKFTVTSAMLKQLQDRQAHYNISWVQRDMDASWLAPSRLLLYPYVARPTPSLAVPQVLIDGKKASVVKQYNSRGNHAIVPAGGGAVSGNTARTFLGWYIDCSHLEPDVEHEISIKFPWKDADVEAHPFAGIYWHNIENSFSQELSQEEVIMV